MTPTQFQELRRLLEGESGVRLLPLETEEDAARLRGSRPSEGVAKAPQGGFAGGAGAGAKPEGEGKFGAGPGDAKKPASARAEEDQKAGESGGKAKEAKASAAPEVVPQAMPAAKGQPEATRRYVFVFTVPPAEKK
jgi:hypothetical protein